MTSPEIFASDAADSPVPQGKDTGIRVGTVQSVSPLIVALQGGSVVSPGFLSPYTPAVNDTVALMRQDNTWMCLGKIKLASLSPNLPVCKIQQNSVQTLVNGATEKITFQQTIYDTDNMADLANNRIVCRTPGLYRGEGQISIDSSGATILLGILSSNIGNFGLETNPNAGTSFWGPYMQMSGTQRLAVGDILEMYVVQLSGASRNTTLTFVPCWLTLEWVGV